MTLNELPIGKEAVISEVGGEGLLRRRLLDMGLTPGAKISVRKTAPMGDPIEIFVRSYSLTLRLAEAKTITIK